MEYVEIDKIINVELGKTPSRNNSDYWNGKHTWIAISDMNKKYIVNSKEKITNEAIENTKIKKVPKDTVIMSFKLSIGKRAITKSEVYTNEAIAAFHIKDLKYLIPEYLYYALESVDFLKYTDKAVKGKTLNKEKLKKIKIPIFPLTEQLKISEILNKTQKIIEDKKKQIFLFDELIKSRFIEMFGDPIRNEKGWEVKKWEEVLKIINGKNQKKVENQSGKYDIFGSGGKMGKADDWLVKENSVLIGRKGSINKPIIVKEKIWNVDTVFGLEPNIEIINCDYLYYFCYFYDFERLNKAVTIPSLTKKDLLKIDIPIPPLVLQEKFVLIHKSINKLKFEAEKSLKEMENLYDSLMQKFFKQ
ncbi:restriction endonuclease S subunit [Leptotrichia trevisanii]|uniref:Restriction endonuclease S subunit n=1 Tax=Leptotrichia trevisanii TaxID=109328 RepID=A0A510KPU3_9FUSO|nr:restriction endonuclease subunit S [Leptotrichia trevisanii]BBM51825.1 restriction endonuclease S subunit [Leptotrichia trevisanii]